MKILYVFFRGILIGTKCISLFYVFYIVSMVINNELYLPLLFIVGILNGFLDGIIVSIKNTIMYKIFSGIFGFIFTIFLLFLSIGLHFPDIFADYFIYGEGGGGLEAGGWFAFNFSLLCYFCISIIAGLPIGMMIIPYKIKK